MKINQFKRIFISISVIIFVIFIWYLIVRLLPYSIIPDPIETGLTFIKMLIDKNYYGSYIYEHIYPSLLRILTGLYFALIFAIPLGLLIGLSKRAKLVISPIVELFRPIPPLAWIPFAIFFFGIGLFSQSFIIFIGAFFPILTNIVKGVEDTSSIYMDVAKTLGANQSDILIHVVFPSTFPSLLAGIRIGLGVGWMCVIAAEIFGINPPLGLGYLINESAQIGRFDVCVVAMIVTGLIGYIMNTIVKLIENKCNWRY